MAGNGGKSGKSYKLIAMIAWCSKNIFDFYK
jgi:hypothetical protein